MRDTLDTIIHGARMIARMMTRFRFTRFYAAPAKTIALCALLLLSAAWALTGQTGARAPVSPAASND